MGQSKPLSATDPGAGSGMTAMMHAPGLWRLGECGAIGPGIRSTDHPLDGLASDPPAAGAPPAWVDGLRQLYRAVVDEPLPEAMLALLAELGDDDAG